MTTPLHKLVEKWRMPDPENSNHYWDARGEQCADELEAALAADNQRWLDLAEELEMEADKEDASIAGVSIISANAKGLRLAAQRIRQMVKEQS